MKKAFLLFSSILIFSTAFSQVKIGLNFNPGICINRMEKNVDTASTYGPKGAGIKFTAGPDIHFFFGDNYGLSLGVWYASKRAGVSIKDKVSGLARQDVYNIQYVQLPMILQLYTNEISTDMKLYFRVGGTFDIKLTSKQKKIAASLAGVSDPIITRFSRFDANIVAGTGIRLQMGDNTYVTGGLRYMRSLINNASAYDLTAPNPVKQFKYNTDILSLDLGVTF